MNKTENAFQVILQNEELWLSFFEELAQLENGSQDIAMNKQKTDLLGEVKLNDAF